MISAKVNYVKKLSPGLWKITLEVQQPISRPKPFTFAMIWVPGVDELPLSISKIEENIIHFVFKIRGAGTQALASLAPGSFVKIKAPLGKGYEPRVGEEILLVAGGVGIAPAPLLVDYCIENGCRVDIVWGVKNSSELCSLNELGINTKFARVFIATEDGSYGFRGTALELASKLLSMGKKYDTVIAVGPKPMLKSFCSDESMRDVRKMVSLETIVKCGLGLCGSCCVRPYPKLLCIHGPVFECEEVMKHFELS